MAFNHILFNSSSVHGAKMRSMLQKFENAYDELDDMRDMIVQMRDGADNPANSANYAEVVKRLEIGGYSPTQGEPTVEQTNKARDMFLLLDAVQSKLTSNTSVTDVRQAIGQLFARLR